jgi:hypothetical protein
MKADHMEVEEETPGDVMEYYLESLDLGLGLDQKALQAKAAATAAASGPSKLSVASPAKPAPVTPTGTPMLRATSLRGAKTASPATSTQQLTPGQAGKNVKPSPGKDHQKDASKVDAVGDPWADAPMSLEKLHDTFQPIFSECRRREMGYDPFEEFMNADMFSGEQSDSTPDSLDVALATQTPDDKTNTDTKEAAKWPDWMPWDAESLEASAEWMAIPPTLAMDDQLLTGGVESLQVDFERLQRMHQESKNLDSAHLPIPAL